jgi:hypothetical protein
MKPAFKPFGLMKKENILAITGTGMLLAAYFLNREPLQESSPLALLILLLAGMMALIRFPLIAGTLLFFSGMALIVHSLMFSFIYWLLPGAFLVCIAGLLRCINWWKQNNN